MEESKKEESKKEESKKEESKKEESKKKESKKEESKKEESKKRMENEINECQRKSNNLVKLLINCLNKVGQMKQDLKK